MKKIEASFIKRFMRISWYLLSVLSFVYLVLELSNYSLSLSHTLGHLEFSWSILDLEQGRKNQAKERKESKD